MSNIVNYKTGLTVDRTDYVDDGFIDVYERNLVEKGLLPCIYYGFNVTAGSGLNVNVAPGAARGQDIVFTINGSTSDPLPTIVNNIKTVSTISIPANSTGWIVLNVNIWDSVENTLGPSSNANLYEIGASTSSSVPSGSSAAPMFVTSLQSNTNSIWPFTQIPLASIISNGSTITTIGQNYNPASVQRAFDFQASLISIAQGKLGTLAYQNANNVQVPVTFNNGAYININPSDTAPTRVASQSYANGGAFTNSNGTCYTLPGGLKIQLMPVTFALPHPGYNDDIIDAAITFPIPFTSINYFVAPSNNTKASSDRGFSGIPTILAGTKTLVGCTIELDINLQIDSDPQPGFNQPQFTVILAIGI